MNWDEDIEFYKEYLKLQRGLSNNSISAYETDIKKLIEYLETQQLELKPSEVKLTHIRGMIEWLAEKGIATRTQARIISGIKQFFKSMIIDERIDEDPTSLIEAPKLGRKLPSVLSVEQIESMLDNIDLSRNDGYRNKAIIGTLYSCGLRVSELTDMQISNISFENGYVRILGKGRKERLVPVNDRVLADIKSYIEGWRSEQDVDPKSSDIVFLNKEGKQMSRISVFNIIKKTVADAGIDMVVSPHTLRHSFATHLIAGGANVRAVQEMLGHATIMTTEIYTHLDRNYLEESIKKHPRS
ncbi:MAG: site-specific tyrosine recombinase [Bacteroidia bacterium]|nr:site-specific tyrosine recombinase [Bacteroidia bacterium]